MKKKRKRQRTVWEYSQPGARGTYMRVGIVHNPGPTISYKPDCVRLEYKSLTSHQSAYMTPEEALTIAKGLTHCVHILVARENLKMVKRP